MAIPNIKIRRRSNTNVPTPVLLDVESPEEETLVVDEVFEHLNANRKRSINQFGQYLVNTMPPGAKKNYLQDMVDNIQCFKNENPTAIDKFNKMLASVNENSSLYSQQRLLSMPMGKCSNGENRQYLHIMARCGTSNEEVRELVFEVSEYTEPHYNNTLRILFSLNYLGNNGDSTLVASASSTGMLENKFEDEDIEKMIEYIKMLTHYREIGKKQFMGYHRNFKL